MIKVDFTGNVVRDPILKYTSQGKAYTHFTCKVNVNKEKNIINWIDVVCFDQMAEYVASSLVNRVRVAVQGNLYLEESTGKDGTKYHNLRCLATDVAASLRYNNVKAEITEVKTDISDSSEIGEDLFDGNN